MATLPTKMGAARRGLLCQLPLPISTVSAFIRVIRGSRILVLAAHAGPAGLRRAGHLSIRPNTDKLTR